MKKIPLAKILVAFTPKATQGSDRQAIDLQVGQIVEYFRNQGVVTIRWGHLHIPLSSEEIANLEYEPTS